MKHIYAFQLEEGDRITRYTGGDRDIPRGAILIALSGSPRSGESARAYAGKGGIDPDTGIIDAFHPEDMLRPSMYRGDELGAWVEYRKGMTCPESAVSE